VIERNVKNHAYAALVRCSDQILQILHRAVIRVHSLIVRNVIPVVAGGGKDRHEPQDPNLQVMVSARITIVQVIEILPDAFEIADLPFRGGAVSLGVSANERTKIW